MIYSCPSMNSLTERVETSFYFHQEEILKKNEYYAELKISTCCFNKEDFLEQLKLIFEKEQKQTFTSDDVIKVMTHPWENQYFSDLAIYTLLQIAKKTTGVT